MSYSPECSYCWLSAVTFSCSWKCGFLNYRCYSRCLLRFGPASFLLSTFVPVSSTFCTWSFYRSAIESANSSLLSAVSLWTPDQRWLSWAVCLKGRFLKPQLLGGWCWFSVTHVTFLTGLKLFLVGFPSAQRCSLFSCPWWWGFTCTSVRTFPSFVIRFRLLCPSKSCAIYECSCLLILACKHSNLHEQEWHETTFIFHQPSWYAGSACLRLRISFIFIHSKIFRGRWWSFWVRNGSPLRSWCWWLKRRC